MKIVKFAFIIIWLIVTIYPLFLVDTDIFFLPFFLAGMSGEYFGYFILLFFFFMILLWFGLFIYVLYTLIENK